MKKLIGLLGIILLIAACTHNIKVTEPAAEPANISEPTNITAPKKTNTSETTKTTAPADTVAPADTTAPQKPSLRVISLDAGNLYFKPKKLTLTLNQPVKINYMNKGEHTFTVNELGVNKILKTDASGSFTFTPKKKGKFELYCATPGHREAGMVGVMEVVD